MKNFSSSFTLPIIIFSLLFFYSSTFFTQINLSTAVSSSIKTTYQNVADCSCNLHPSICDNFCCCDSSCSESQISTWTTSEVCRTSKSNIQRFCDDLQSGAYYSFEDLGCVYYSNRGNIGYFYDSLTAGAINYPTPQKFVNQADSSESINLKSSAAGSNSYSSSQYLLKVNKDNSIKYFQMWVPIAGGDCGIGFVKINESITFTCQYPLSISTCEKSTDHLQGTVKICKTGNCTDTQNLTTVAAATLIGNTGCNNFITAQTITLTLQSSGSSYQIITISVSLTQGTVSFSGNSRYPIKTTINVQMPSTSIKYSGNPGYQFGKSVIFQNQGISANLFKIADGSGNCLTTSTSALDVLFGQNIVYSCFSSSPCSQSLYIDSLAKQTTFKIQKWATGSTDKVLVGGTNSTLNTCGSQTVILNILYTEAGWVLYKQNYIIGSSITTKQSSQSSWNRKYLKINWIYVDPDTITNPPTNSFYEYFSYIWKPLRQYFGVYST